MHGIGARGVAVPEGRGVNMILEVATLDVKPGESEAFKAAFFRAQTIIVSMPGYVSHQLQHCLERPARYLLLVNWQTLEDHTVGFRESAQYQQWRDLLHHFYEPFPEVEHFELVYHNGHTGEGDTHSTA